MRFPYSAQRRLKISRQRTRWRVDELAACDDDEVKRGPAKRLSRVRLLRAEERPQPSLGAIALDGTTDAPRRHDTQAIAVECVRGGDDRQKLCAHAPSFALHAQKLLATPQPDIAAELSGHDVVTTKLSASSGPWRGVA